MRAFSFSISLYKSILFGLFIFIFALLAKPSFAATTGQLVPSADGFYTQMTPSTGSTHYTLVDETTCNGNTDYNSETSVGQRDSYNVNLSSIPNGSLITQISITPCASKNANGGNNTVFDVFYRLNGVDSADMPGYVLTTTTPTNLTPTVYSGLSTTKNSLTTLEIGGVHTSGNRGTRLSHISTVITYTPLTAPSSPSATAISNTEIDYLWSDNSSNEDGFVIERSPNGVSGWTPVSTTSANATVFHDSMLTPNTFYFYRVYAFNSGGQTTTTGSVGAKTLPNPPTVTTETASAIALTSASTSATVNPNGASTSVVFRYDTSNVDCASLANTTGSVAYGSGSTPINKPQQLTSLTANTTYYYCAVGTNSGGTTYGSVLSFTTLSNTPIVTTDGVGFVFSTAASVSATINPNGLSTSRNYRYDTSNTSCPSLSNTTTPVNIGSGMINIKPNAELLLSLTPNTTYYYCIEATNSAGTSYGSVLSFTTTP